MSCPDYIGDETNFHDDIITATHLRYLQVQSIPMKAKTNQDVFATVTNGLGITAEKSPSISFPIAVNLLYYNNPDGSVRCIWPKGEWMKKAHRLLFSLGWQNALPDRLVLYTDVPTATQLHMNWQQNKMLFFGSNQQMRSHVHVDKVY